MPRVVIHWSLQIPQEHVEEIKTLFKELMREALAEPGCEYYVGEHTGASCVHSNSNLTAIVVFSHHLSL
jgi:quinol monooxygenase YgiN